MKLCSCVCGVFAFGGVSAQQNTWQPSPGHTQVAIWPETPPDAQPVPGAGNGGNRFRFSRCWRAGHRRGNVTRPTMTSIRPMERIQESQSSCFPAEDLRTGIDLEGTEGLPTG